MNTEFSSTTTSSNFSHLSIGQHIWIGTLQQVPVSFWTKSITFDWNVNINKVHKNHKHLTYPASPKKSCKLLSFVVNFKNDDWKFCSQVRVTNFKSKSEELSPSLNHQKNVVTQVCNHESGVVPVWQMPTEMFFVSLPTVHITSSFCGALGMGEIYLAVVIPCSVLTWRWN